MTDSRQAVASPPANENNKTGVEEKTTPVGEQIRDLRKAKGMTITALADSIDRSVGYVSQIERNITAVSIDRLKEFADALGVQISWFFHGGMSGPRDERDLIVRKGDRRKLTFTGSGLKEELLSPNLSGDFEMIMTTYEPHASTGEDMYGRPCQEAALVLSGRLEIWLARRHFILNEGDSITFDGDVPHKSANPDDTPATVVWVMSPPTY